MRPKPATSSTNWTTAYTSAPRTPFASLPRMSGSPARNSAASICISRQELRAGASRCARGGDGLAQPGAGGPVPSADVMPDELKAALLLFASVLDEKTRRLYAGLEALKTGRGGDQRIAALLGIDPGTVARGRRELLERDIEVERVRRAGGGRKAAEKK